MVWSAWVLWFVLLLGLLSLLVVDYVQLIVPNLYQMVINGINQGTVVIDGTSYPFDMTFLLEHKKGVLSSVLNTISKDSGSVMTINQGIPLQGVANATVSIETANLSIDLEALMDKLRMVDGVKRLEVLGQAQN